jgi:hypothetical protein
MALMSKISLASPPCVVVEDAATARCLAFEVREYAWDARNDGTGRDRDDPRECLGKAYGSSVEIGIRRDHVHQLRGPPCLQG